MMAWCSFEHPGAGQIRLFCFNRYLGASCPLCPRVISLFESYKRALNQIEMIEWRLLIHGKRDLGDLEGSSCIR